MSKKPAHWILSLQNYTIVAFTHSLNVTLTFETLSINLIGLQSKVFSISVLFQAKFYNPTQRDVSSLCYIGYKSELRKYNVI